MMKADGRQIIPLPLHGEPDQKDMGEGVGQDIKEATKP
jgi:hypothetical protein